MAAVDLVITDVDGTLVLPGKHNPTMAVRQAVTALDLAGISLTAATGRPYEMTKNLFLDVGLKDDCIFDNGATIRKLKTGEIVWKNWLSVNRLKQIAAIMLPHSKIVDFSPGWQEQEATDVNIDDIVESAPYGFALVPRHVAAPVIKKLKSLEAVNVYVGDSFESIDLVGIQVTDLNANKFHAVNKLRELAHTTKSHTLSIGDGPNDLPLFQASDIKVAMGNATKELKALADFVVAPVERDGFAEAMQKFVLNNYI
jgi:HAD superfamily hydrolase (TIGR01484 family)